MLWVKVLVAFMTAPGLVDVLLPALILWKTGALRWPGMGVLQIIGLFFIAAGVAILTWVFHAFVHYGHGTPAPFDPPHQFMRQGLYLWVRNPMVLAAVVLIPLAEALFFESWLLAGYMAVLILTMHLYLVLIEEKELERRFGKPYLKYKRTVPRWIPRRPRD